MVNLWALNKALKAHDRTLYARQSKDGVVRVYQRTKSWVEIYRDEFKSVKTLCDGEWHVCSLTDTWAANGKPQEWGIEPVMDHIRRNSLEYRDNLLREIEQEQERRSESRARDVRNISEAVAFEMREDMKHAFKDVLTHSMDMSKDVRRKTENRRK